MRRAIALWLLALAACTGPCTDEAPISQVDFVGPGPGSQLDLDAGKAQTWLTAAAQDIEGFAVRRATASEAGWQLTVRTQLATERTDEQDASRVRRALGAAAELRRLVPAEHGAPSRFQAEIVEVRTAPRGAPVDEHLKATLEALIGRLRTAVRLARASPEQIVQAIGGDDDHARAVAIGMARARRLQAARPALEARLRDEATTPQEALRLAGALGDLGHPDSAAAIIDTISRFPQHTVPLLFVLGRIGGRQALAYLFTVQSGHEQEGVRAAAAEALGEAERRASDAERR